MTPSTNRRSDPVEPTVAVVIAARNEAKTIGACLESLRRQTYACHEVFVVDDASVDETAQIASRFSEVRLVKGTGDGPSRARNLGIHAARSDIVAFTDADCICDERWIESLVEALRSGFDAAGGRQGCPANETEFGRRVQAFLESVGFVSDYLQAGEGIRATKHNPSCNSAYWRQGLLEIGGFDERLWPGEDTDLDFRLREAGRSIGFHGGARVLHYRADGWAGFARMMQSYGRAQAWLVRKHGPFRPLHLVPLASLVLVPALLTPAGAAAVALFFSRKGSTRSELPAQYGMLMTTLGAWNLGFAQGLLQRTIGRPARVEPT